MGEQVDSARDGSEDTWFLIGPGMTRTLSKYVEKLFGNRETMRQSRVSGHI